MQKSIVSYVQLSSRRDYVEATFTRYPRRDTKNQRVYKLTPARAKRVNTALDKMNLNPWIAVSSIGGLIVTYAVPWHEKQREVTITPKGAPAIKGLNHNMVAALQTFCNHNNQAIFNRGYKRVTVSIRRPTLGLVDRVVEIAGKPQSVVMGENFNHINYIVEV